MSDALLEAGVYIKGLWYPVVPRGEARLRVQISAALDRSTLDQALSTFERIGRQLKVI
jgi:glycine C-acetyltransferase